MINHSISRDHVVIAVEWTPDTAPPATLRYALNLFTSSSHMLNMRPLTPFESTNLILLSKASHHLAIFYLKKFFIFRMEPWIPQFPKDKNPLVNSNDNTEKRNVC